MSRRLIQLGLTMEEAEDLMRMLETLRGNGPRPACRDRVQIKVTAAVMARVAASRRKTMPAMRFIDTGRVDGSGS